MEWQPIETAPRDGTYVLVASPVADEYGCRHYVARWADYGEWAGPYADGYQCALDDIGVGPSHWMPLPQPPAEAA